MIESVSFQLQQLQISCEFIVVRLSYERNKKGDFLLKHYNVVHVHSASVTVSRPIGCSIAVRHF